MSQQIHGQADLPVHNQGDQNQAQDSNFYTTWHSSNDYKKGT